VPAKMRPVALPDLQPERRRRERHAGTQMAVRRDKSPGRARSAGGGGSRKRRPSR
jgi:hypothetical protein